MQIIPLAHNEYVVQQVHRHWFMLVRDVGGTVIIGLLPFLFLPFLSELSALPFSAYLSPALIIFLSVLWMQMAWMAIVALWTEYILDRWIITNRHIININQVSLFSRVVATWDIDHIQEINVTTNTFIEALFGFGTIEVLTAGPSERNATIEGIPHPEAVRTLILEQQQQTNALAETNQKQEHLLKTVSHEVKGYLTRSAAALASIAEGDTGAVNAETKKIADEALTSTREGVHTVLGILKGADLKAGDMQLEVEPFDLKETVAGIVEDLRPLAEKRKLSLSFAAGHGDFRINGDSGKLRRHVFRNLIDNAIRYTEHGNIVVSLSQAGHQVRFSVKDTGVGVTKEDMQLLFTEGGKGHATKNVNPESTGYGLFVAKQIVDLHGGEIWAESDGHNKGAQFIVLLPLEQ